MESEEKVRVTLLMPKSTDRKIEVYAALMGQAKNVVVTTALDGFLDNSGLALDPPAATPRRNGKTDTNSRSRRAE